MDLEELDNGTLIPAMEERVRFAEWLWAAIRYQVMEGKEKIFLVIEGERVLCRLPSSRQLLDFVSLRATDNPNIVDVHLDWPEDNGDKNVWSKMHINISTN